MISVESIQLMINNLLGGGIHQGSSAISDLMILLHLI